jgi:hypothetical protein
MTRPFELISTVMMTGLTMRTASSPLSVQQQEGARMLINFAGPALRRKDGDCAHVRGYWLTAAPESPTLCHRGGHVMELLFGSHVRSGGRRIGYLAGVEVDAASRRVTKIVFSQDGKLGSHAHTQSVDTVRVERGALVLGDAPTTSSPSAATEPILLSRSVRVVRQGKHAGHVAGVVVGDLSAMEAAIGRQHWWSGRYHLPAADIDLSHPGEIRAGAVSSRAA